MDSDGNVDQTDVFDFYDNLFADQEVDQELLEEPSYSLMMMWADEDIASIQKEYWCDDFDTVFNEVFESLGQ